jgi:hypothetical protein
MRTDGHTNITKLTDAFLNFPYEPKIFLHFDDKHSLTEILKANPQIEQTNGMYKTNGTRGKESRTEMKIPIV